MQPPPRIPVTPADIDRIVTLFYARIRTHQTLGPVFASHVTDWPLHEAKIASFWRNAILHERAYSGNPMQVHRGAGNVHPGHFTPWLALFDTVLHEVLASETALAFSALAHRIGAGLRMGLVEVHSDPQTPPNLRRSGFR